MGMPTRAEAGDELRLAASMNPGPWEAHSRNVARAAELIARRSGLDGDRAYCLGLLHDVGRRVGYVNVKHIIAGYEYLSGKGWDEAARVCLTHSYPLQDAKTDIGVYDITDAEFDFLDRFLKSYAYTDYDRLIILCDSCATPKGFCILEKRFVDTTRRYGAFPYTVARWNAVFEIKEHFEALMGASLYDALPGVREGTFLD